MRSDEGSLAYIPSRIACSYRHVSRSHSSSACSRAVTRFHDPVNAIRDGGSVTWRGEKVIRAAPYRYLENTWSFRMGSWEHVIFQDGIMRTRDLLGGVDETCDPRLDASAADVTWFGVKWLINSSPNFEKSGVYRLGKTTLCKCSLCSVINSIMMNALGPKIPGI